MERNSYYEDRKYCPQCDGYVPYLMSIEHSFCVECGSEVRLFSSEDWQDFNQTLAAKRPKGGRPKKKKTSSGGDDRASA